MAIVVIVAAAAAAVATGVFMRLFACLRIPMLRLLLLLLLLLLLQPLSGSDGGGGGTYSLIRSPSKACRPTQAQPQSLSRAPTWPTSDAGSSGRVAAVSMRVKARQKTRGARGGLTKGWSGEFRSPIFSFVAPRFAICWKRAGAL